MKRLDTWLSSMHLVCVRARWKRWNCWRVWGVCLRRGFWRTATFLLLLGLLAMDMRCERRTWRRFRRGWRW